MSQPHNIPAEERRWLSESFVDPNGRVFEWRGEIYRVLTANDSPLWHRLFENGVIEELIRDKLLVETERTNLANETEGLIIRHRKIPVVSYCFEWVPAMLKDAALLTVELCIRLAERELTLQDGHPWNILFAGTTPVFVDLGSIIPARDDVLWAPYEQFCHFFLFPLYLYAAGRDRIARWLLRDYLNGVKDGDLLAALPLSFRLCHPRRTLGIAIPRSLAKIFEWLPEEMQSRFLSLAKKANSGLARHKIRLKFLEALRKDVAGVRVPQAKSYWASYYDTADKSYFSTGLSPGEWQLKQEIIRKIIADLSPPTVLDVGTNTGQYAVIAASSAARVTACDLDVPSLSVCYNEARKRNLNILPLVANVFSMSPIPGRGGVAHAAATERFRSDFVMGLAIMHHVVASQRLNIAQIAEIFNALCSRWLLLEFVPPLKPRVGASVIPSLDDYSSSSLAASLQERFKSVDQYRSYPKDRILFLCEK